MNEIQQKTPRLILLGTKGGPSVRATGGTQSASALLIDGQLCIIDCGLSVSRRAVEAGLSLQALRYVFITHHHSDHTLEYGGLLHNAWMNGLKTPVDVYGPPGIQAMTQAFWDYMQLDLNIRINDEKRPDIRPFIRAQSYRPGPVMENATMRVTAMWVPHPPVHDNCALKFELKDADGHISKTIVFSSDTRYYPPLAEFAHDADVLIHEVMHTGGLDALIKRTPNADPVALRDHMHNSHTPAEDVGRIATAANVKQLVLNHFVPADDTSITSEMWVEAVRSNFAGKIVVGRDLLEIDLSL